MVKSKVRHYVPLFAVLFGILASTAFAQVRNAQFDNPKYGDTPEAREMCLKNTSFYTEYYKQNNFKDAAMGWAIVYRVCPRSSENVYIRGLRMIKKSIAECANPDERRTLIDSMLSIYRQRMKYFRKEGYNYANMGSDLYMFDPGRSDEAYTYLAKAYSLEGNKLDLQAALVLMKTTIDQFDEHKFPADSVINMYSRLSEVFTAQSKKSPNDDKIALMSESLDQMFTGAGVADCDNLIAIYGPKLEANPNDSDLARSIYNQLSSLRCTDSELYLKAASTLFSLAPTSMMGAEIARLYQARHQNPEADQYYRQSISVENNPETRAKLLIEYATFVGTNLGEVARARSLANEALRYDPKAGMAYFLIGHLYAGTKNCGASKMDNASVLWAAVDKFNQAKAVDPSLAADCDKQIQYLSQYFPTTEEIFFSDLEVGKSYKVPCWINETTTIRARSK